MMMNRNFENRISDDVLTIISAGEKTDSKPEPKYHVGDHVLLQGDLWNDKAEITDIKYDGCWFYYVEYDAWYMLWANCWMNEATLVYEDIS